MKVTLTYFKKSGNYYAEGSYETSIPHMDLGDRSLSAPALCEIWDEVDLMKSQRKLPGLMEGRSEFAVIVQVPDHPHSCPRLIPFAVPSVDPVCRCRQR